MVKKINNEVLEKIFPDNKEMNTWILTSQFLEQRLAD
jgi:hypothetical protein